MKEDLVITPAIMLFDEKLLLFAQYLYCTVLINLIMNFEEFWKVETSKLQPKLSSHFDYELFIRSVFERDKSQQKL